MNSNISISDRLYCLMLAVNVGFISIESIVLSSEMHIFDVGQGNCQLNKYVIEYNKKDQYGVSVEQNKREVIGFLYDCGSSEYPKRISDQNEYMKEMYKGDLGEKREKKDLDYQISCISLNQEDDTLIHEINDKLTDLNLLVIILSHPDQDHINIINHIIDPKDLSEYCNNTKKELSKRNPDLKIVAFLCGDWTKNTNIAQSIKETLERERLYNYWDDSKQTIRKENLFVAYPHNFKDFNGDLMCDTLNNSMNIEKLFYLTKHNYARKHILLTKFDGAISELRSFIFIWLMNTNIEGNDNSASPIISFTHKYKYQYIDKENRLYKNHKGESVMQEIDIVKTKNKYISMLCTGDADAYTIVNFIYSYFPDAKGLLEKAKELQKCLEHKHSKNENGKHIGYKEYIDAYKEVIKYIGKTNLFREMIKTNFGCYNEDIDIICIAPHHGSQEQYYDTLLLYKLFKFSAIYVSNGQGIREPHAHINWFLPITIGKNQQGSYCPKIENIEDHYKQFMQNIKGAKDCNENLTKILNKGITLECFSSESMGFSSQSQGFKQCPEWLYSTNSHGEMYIKFNCMLSNQLLIDKINRCMHDNQLLIDGYMLDNQLLIDKINTLEMHGSVLSDKTKKSKGRKVPIIKRRMKNRSYNVKDEYAYDNLMNEISKIQVKAIKLEDENQEAQTIIKELKAKNQKSKNKQDEMQTKLEELQNRIQELEVAANTDTQSE
ncbi:hypothetical protein [Candidatus Cytomitobacter primus]|uniref:Uncharacterized protein n=1 Tax=Candidatus Cytomitobacter primus TaxID=2066024 RepID=A0A5C0UG06_9PROT|nr:hypothetical protein [Candidatus Cytomitobacter primus]QEK38657.1 hypothetical protein FZC34_01910 [Candidatus Cytomitobacter primus]